jgi:hypothetical protein
MKKIFMLWSFVLSSHAFAMGSFLQCIDASGLPVGTIIGDGAGKNLFLSLDAKDLNLTRNGLRLTPQAELGGLLTVNVDDKTAIVIPSIKIDWMGGEARLVIVSNELLILEANCKLNQETL